MGVAERSSAIQISEVLKVTIVRVGTTKKYSDNWTTVFGGKKKAAAPAKVSAASAKPGKKTAKKSGKKVGKK